MAHDGNQTDAFPAPGDASRRLSFSIQCLNVLALALNAGLLGILARRQPRTGAKGLILLAGAEMGINLSLLLMHSEAWASSPLPVVDKFNYSFEAFHLLRNAWLSVMTIARALAVSRPFSSSRLLTRRQQAVIFGVEAAASAAWSLADLLLVNDGSKTLRRGLALLRHFLNTVVAGGVIVVTSSVIVHHVRRSPSVQQPQHRRRERQASKIVVTLAVGFFLLEVPNALVVYIGIIWLMVNQAGGFAHSFAEALHVVYRVNHLLIVLNTCLNPFVLIAFSSGFRNQVRESLACRQVVGGPGGGGGEVSGVTGVKGRMKLVPIATARDRLINGTPDATAEVTAAATAENVDDEQLRLQPLVSHTDDEF